MGATQPKVKPEPASAGSKHAPLTSGIVRTIALILVLLTCGIVVYRTWWLFMAAWITQSNKREPAIYERAIRYDPNNADYHFTLAQIYNYSTQYLNITRAGEEYEAAVRLNPNRSRHWLELSKYYEQAGNSERSRAAMKMALDHDPNYAQVHWAAANLYIRLNDLAAADFELRRTADLDVSYMTQILDLVWQFYEDPARIMSTHVPNTKQADLTALNYFITQKSESGAVIAWSRLKSFQTTAAERLPYVDYLTSLGKPHDAWDVFGFQLADPGSVVFNSSFETEPLNGGFDWRFSSSDHAEPRRDTTNGKTGLASWLVTFNGTENVDYSGLSHLIPVAKGQEYKLTFWMKTEAITTNEGIFVEVDGATSEKQVGTTPWRQFTIPFVATSDLVTVRLRRVPSRKLDNLIKGKVWLDDFALEKIGV